MTNEVLQKEIGITRSAKHYLVEIEGLPNANIHDVVLTDNGGRALVTGLKSDLVEAVMLDNVSVRPGQQFNHPKQAMQLSIGEHLLGRVVNALTDPIDGKKAVPPKNAPIVVQREAGEIANRKPVTEQLYTGYMMTDTVLPIGKGQRQLLMGPVQSGTDIFCREVIKYQAGQDVICIYVTIGKSSSYVKRLADNLFAGEASKYATIIAGTSEDTSPLNIIAPSVGIQVAEYFCNQGKDVLLVMDDLYTHAKYLREVSLLQGRLPGRESYPGDIFFQQAHLIERAGNFSGRGSISLLPVLQTDIESSTDLIKTNVMSTTDGHVSFSSALYASGVFPPVGESESVTRVGKHTQSMVQKQLGTTITSVLGEAKEQERFVQFGTQISEASRQIIKTGRLLRSLLNQEENKKIPFDIQAIILALAFTSLTKDKDERFFDRCYETLVEVCVKDKKLADIRHLVTTGKSFNEFKKALEEVVPALNQICQT